MSKIDSKHKSHLQFQINPAHFTDLMSQGELKTWK